jgi:hypothetical protein
MHDPYEISNNLFKVDLSQDKLKPIMLILKDLDVLSFTNNTIILSLKSKENIKKMFDDIDTYIVKLIQEKKITKKLKTKFNYRQLTSTFTNKDLTCEILSLNVELESNYKTEIYEKKNKKLTIDNAIKLMKDNAKVDLVLELMSVSFNKDDKFIYLDNVVRQMKVKKVKPKRIEKLEYSFIDSDSEESDKLDSYNSYSSESDKLDSENSSEIELELDKLNSDKLNSDKLESDKLDKSTDDDCLVNNENIDFDLESELDTDTSN